MNDMLSEERLKYMIINDKNDIRLDKIKKIIRSEIYNLLTNYFLLEKDAIVVDIKYTGGNYELIFKTKFDSIKMCNCL